MRKLKVMTVVGTRPEVIRLSRVLPRLDETCDHVLVHTGQNYDHELNRIFFEDLALRAPDHLLACAGATAAETIGKVIAGVDAVLESERPEALLVLGDTNSCLCVVAAKRRRIPIFHMEAGNRCFDARVPEETNRRIVDHTADVNLTYSTVARDYLLREGLRPDLVIRTGSPMFEVLAHNRDRIAKSDVLDRLALTAGAYFVVSAHREENVDEPYRLARLADLLNGVAADHGLPVIVSTHPRTAARIEASGLRFDGLVRLLKPLGFTDYVRLQNESRAVLSDSGTISEESSILGFPALNLRETHERPEAMEAGAVMMVGLSPERVRQGLALLASRRRRDEARGIAVADYRVADVSERVVAILHSYTDYVRRVVWQDHG